MSVQLFLLCAVKKKQREATFISDGFIQGLIQYLDTVSVMCAL